MKKTILLATILLYSVGVPQMPKDGLVSFGSSYNRDIFKETGDIIFNHGMIDVTFNDEVIATIESERNPFAYSLKNGQLMVAIYKANRIKDTLWERYTIMYTIDIESKTVKKAERLNAKYTYKDSDLELSLIGDFKYTVKDTSKMIIQYTWKGKTNKVVLSEEEKNVLTEVITPYISESGSLVACYHSGLYVFSMDKKKFTHLGRFFFSSHSNFCIPLKEYVIYYPWEGLSTDSKVYLYRYAEEELYVTRYQKNIVRDKTKDTIISNIKSGNIYEQFLPLTRVENIDSMLYPNTWKARHKSGGDSKR
ncbi:MAG: hypothetical protein LBQ87_03425 [Candidatus Fibromonas sp.]|jgi:archaellum component FlaF (FlaF/FlaG flagellin family)|nr:hypothetical protein [Candidatus Fibromonas sp.]